MYLKKVIVKSMNIQYSTDRLNKNRVNIQGCNILTDFIGSELESNGFTRKGLFKHVNNLALSYKSSKCLIQEYFIFMPKV